MTDDEIGGSAVPALATGEPGIGNIDEALVVNGTVDVRKTHPTLFRTIVMLAVLCVLLGLNFIVFTPTFRIYGLPKGVWGAIFLTLGVSKLVFLLVVRRLKVVRIIMAFATAYFMFLAVGTSQPLWDGVGSLQLPIMYASVAAMHVPWLLEPFINPFTARRDP